MTLIVLIAAGVAAAAHVAFWLLEAVLWRLPAVHRVFGAATAEEAAALAPAFFNLGYYNLFLGLGAGAGAFLWERGDGETLLAFTLAFMVAAALVLVASAPRMWRGALLFA